MLYEIICDRFHQKRVEFHAGLNSVLGDDIGSNSIGKSTFLMIIDFVFGGNDYIIRSTDIQRNVGSHAINFCFIFESKKYYFSRSTKVPEVVYKCNEKYEIIDEMSLEKYCIFLKGKYCISIQDLSFRNMVGRFSRIYGKENLDEKHPLHIVHNEKAGEPINALLKIFQLYEVIKELEDIYKECGEQLKIYKQAQKYKFINSIGRKQYNDNIKMLNALIEDKTNLLHDIEFQFIDLDTVKTDEFLSLKNELSRARRNKSKLKNQLEIIKDNIAENSNLKPEQYDELLQFFPNAAIKHIDEIERFHHGINNILKLELKKKEKDLEKLLTVAEEHIRNIEQQISELQVSPKVSKVVLSRYSAIQRQIEDLIKENEEFDRLDTLVKNKDVAKKRRDLMRNEQLNILQNQLNSKMSAINDYIYSNKKQPPIITFNDGQYDFQTINDTGTGTSYKSMIVYDLSVLELTKLPILIHDSVVLKQISDTAIEKILLMYEEFDKQIFIAFDKMSSYSKRSKEILEKEKVLSLSDNGNELFGCSWNEK